MNNTDIQSPLVSVIIPAYNCAAFLPEAIESVFAQTYVNCEIVVVNDGSPDNTDEVINPYLGKITYVKQENKGLSAARNTGFGYSKGKFLCFLDADDYLYPEKICRQIAVFQKNKKAGVVICGFDFVTEDGRTVMHSVRKNWYGDAIPTLLNHESFACHVALIKREVFENSIRFDETIPRGEYQEDWKLWIDFALDKVEFDSVPNPLCAYRYREGAGSRNILKHIDGARRVVRWLQQDPRTKKFQQEVNRLSKIIEMERVARAWQAGELEIAREALVNAIKTSLAFWLAPFSYNHLFYRCLSIQEQAEWMKERKVDKFRNRVLNEILPLANSHVDRNTLRKVYATAELACSNMAYHWEDSQNRWDATLQALQLAPRHAFSRQAVSSTIRGLLGPSILEPLLKMRALWS